MARSSGKDAQALFHSLRSAYAATPTNLKVFLYLHKRADSRFVMYRLKIIILTYDFPFFWLNLVAGHRSVRGFRGLYCGNSGGFFCNVILNFWLFGSAVLLEQ